MMKFKKMDYNEVLETTKDMVNNEGVIESEFNIQDFDFDEYSYTNVEDIIDKELKYIEGFIRRSNEYSRYRAYLETELDITHDAILKNIDIKETQVGFQIHHYPFTLYTITDTIIRHKLSYMDKVTMFDICEEVMHEHYLGNIGLLGLTTTGHELYHSGRAMIPWNEVYGNPDEFVNRYRSFINPEALAAYERAKSITPEQAHEHNSQLYSKTVISYNIDYEHGSTSGIRKNKDKDSN